MSPAKRGIQTVLNRQNVVRVSVAPLQNCLRRVCDEIGIGPVDVTVCLVSDAEIARMNEKFRKKKGPTDVLSFPVAKRRRTHSFLGDIAISPATARRNAKIYGRTISTELRILILHGVLHLQGYDHETDRGEMDRVEHRLRRKLGLARAEEAR